MEKVGCWLKEIRAPFLLLSIVLVFLGTSIAVSEGHFFLDRAVMAAIGLVLLHISVNVLNEYSDYCTGIDFHTSPTPFSGGSGMLTAGKIPPSAAHYLGLTCLVFGIVIGLYFVWLTNLWLMPLLLIGGFFVYFYTDYLARCALGEISAGLGLGFLPILGAYFVQTGHYSISALAMAIPAGILTFNLLLLNEFPDLHADVRGGRKNLLIVFGVAQAGKIYAISMAAMYVWIIIAALIGIMPIYSLLGLLTVLVGWKPIIWAWTNVNDKTSLIPAMGANVFTNLGTQVLLGVGFLASSYFGVS